MKEALAKFVRDLLEGAIASGAAAVLLLNLDVVDAKTVLFVFLTGAIGGALAAARRQLTSPA